MCFPVPYVKKNLQTCSPWAKIVLLWFTSFEKLQSRVTRDKLFFARNWIFLAINLMTFLKSRKRKINIFVRHFFLFFLPWQFGLEDLPH